MIDPTSLLPGVKPTLEFLRFSPARIKKIFIRSGCRAAASIAALAAENRIPVIAAEQSELDRLCASGSRDGARTSHQGVVAVLSENLPVSLERLLQLAAPMRLIIALDQIQDPGNLGTISRTAWAMGCQGLLLPEHNSARPGPAALRSSAGALALLPWCQAPNLARALDKAEEAGFAIYGADHYDSGEACDAFAFEWRLPAVLVLGSENRGLRAGVSKRCSKILDIPMARNFNSLNVAQAGAILIGFCAARNRANQ